MLNKVKHLYTDPSLTLRMTGSVNPNKSYRFKSLHCIVLYILAKVMTEGHENQTLAWNAGEIVLKHTVKHFEGMHHQALLALVMRVASCSCKIVAVLDELDEIVDAFTVDFREEGDYTVFHFSCIHFSIFSSVHFYL